MKLKVLVFKVVLLISLLAALTTSSMLVGSEVELCTERPDHSCADTGCRRAGGVCGHTIIEGEDLCSCLF
jgi:hypothetical protein